VIHSPTATRIVPDPVPFNDDPRPRVVIADDHPSVLLAFARMLQPRCEVVATVPDGYAAIEAVRRLKPDVLLVDLMLPDVDGMQVCRCVKRTAPETDVVIVTAFDDAQVQAIAMQDGAAAFLPKHSAAATLEETILQIFVERQRARQ
jgi:DNA-binding NarL/FixJ family response regulator